MCFCWTFYLSVFTCKCTLFNFFMKERAHFILIDVVHFPACKLCISLTIFRVSTLFTESSTFSILYPTASLANANWICFQCRRIHTKYSHASNSFALSPKILLFVSLQGCSQHHVCHLLKFQGEQKKEVLSWYSC